jgi:fructose-bisphosphate aldolase class II
MARATSVLWRIGLEDGLTRHPHELAPYKILPAAVKAVEQVVHARLSLFSGG